MGLIKLEDIELYAYHGCYEKELTTGNWFLVNLELETNMEIPSNTDNIDDALNYQVVYELVNEVMEIRSHLLENVSKRILDALFTRFSQLDNATVKVSKLNPPVGGQVKCVSVELSQHRN